MQYIGARYVPKFMGTYDPTQAYENMCVVDNGLGTSYISVKPTPAGTPLTDTDFWAVYGASSGAIINLQNQIGDLTDLDTTDKDNLVDAINENVSDIQALTTIVNSYSHILTVGKNGAMYTKPSDAYTAARSQATSDAHVLILIYGGEYEDQITAIDTHYIDIIGIGNVIIRDHQEYPYSPLYVGGDMYIENIYFIADDPGTPNTTYAVHVEGPEAGRLEFVNCRFLTSDAAAVGSGFCQDRTVEFDNCRFSSSYSKGLYVHNYGLENTTNQMLIMKDCIFENATLGQPVFAAEDARYRAGTEGTVTSILDILAINCVGSRNAVEYQQVVSGVTTSLPYIPLQGAGYQIALSTWADCPNLFGLSAIKQKRRFKSNTWFDASGITYIPFPDADKYTVTGTVKFAGDTGPNITSTCTFIAQEGAIKIQTNDSQYYANIIWVDLTLTTK